MSNCIRQTTSKYTSRPSPPYPANDCKGETKKGNDGNMYISKSNAKGIFQWKIITDKSLSTTKKSSKTTKTSRKTSRKSHETSTNGGYHNLLFLEPSTASDSLYKKKGKQMHFGSDFKVNDTFYKTLLKKPKSRFCQYGNAYIFGKKFPLDDYFHLGSMGNDVAQTGLVDADIMRNKDSTERLGNYDLWKKAYPLVFKKGSHGRWSDRPSLIRIRQVLPEVIFVGDTVGGDVGSDLWVHHDVNKDIDGLIIDNHCIFAHMYKED